jgi:probable rRNA maturation factor
MKVTGAAHTPPPSKMILLDPDMDPDPAPTTLSAKKTAAPGPSALKKSLRLPSARTLARFLAEAQTAVRLKGEVTVLLTTDAAIRRLNRQFRGKDKSTDVLSFPADGIGAEEIAGDLAISVPTALKQAAEQGHALSSEIKVLILHGLLHLAGYDHEADEGKMARREGQLRAKLGLPQGLIERSIKAPKTPALKGHGFSRAAKTPKKAPALAAEGKFGSASRPYQGTTSVVPKTKKRKARALAPAGRSFAEKANHQGLKPNITVANRSARLKSCPDTNRGPDLLFPQPVNSRPDTSTGLARKPRTQTRNRGQKP